MYPYALICSIPNLRLASVRRSLALSLLCLAISATGARAGLIAPQTITLVVRAGAPAYYMESGRLQGLDYDLAQLLAQRENIRLNIITVRTAAQALEILRRGDADIAAGHLALQPSKHPDLIILPAYSFITRQLAYYYSEDKPADLGAIPCERLEVAGHPGHRLLLEQLKAPTNAGPECPPPTIHANTGAREILRLVDQGLIGYTPVDSSDIQIYRHRYPRLKIAFDLPGDVPVAWFANAGLSPGLYAALTRFFVEINRDGNARRIFQRYFQHTEPLEYGAKLTFIRNANTLLKKHLSDFRRVADELGMDWRLLAAISYQESLWDRKAVSPSFAKGLMMLTLPIAAEHGVEDRFDAPRNIEAGAEYFMDLRKRMPETMEEPDRTWFALAAYNIGPRYVFNARTLTREAGKNPDWWMHVRDYFKAARRDSDAPVRFDARTYVYNILHYRDLLYWLDRELRLFQSGG